MNIFGKVLLLLIGVAAAPLAPALSLGNITGNGAVGERLDAWVPLYLAPAERDAIKGAQLLPDVFVRRVADDPALNDIRATVEHLATGSFIHLQSTTPIAVKQLQFRLRVETARSAVVGRYELRLLNMRAVRMVPRIIARPRAMHADTSMTAAAVRPDNAYGPVRSGESLWTIARRLARGGNVQQMMNDLHALNPTAFIGGNADRLRAGVMLTMQTSAALPSATVRTSGGPAAAAAAATADDNASATAVKEAAEASAAEQDAFALSADAIDGLLAEDVVGTKTPVVPAIAATTRDGNSRDAALTAKLAALDTKFAAIRARYGQPTSRLSAGLIDKDAQAAVPQKSPTRVEAPGAAPKPAPVVTQTVIAAAVTRQPATKPAQFESTPAPALTDSGLLAKWAGYAIAALFATALGIWTCRVLGRFMASRRTRASVASGRSAEAGRKAEVARKAENRIRMESEIRGLLDRKSPGKPRAEAAPAPASLDITVEPAPVSTLKQTLDVLPASSLTGSPERDREVAIDANIAHGRYAEAEALLRDVIATHARNFQARLRLAEVYYITEQIERFTEVATDIKEHHRPDLTDEEWQRVVRMGKIIAPDLVLFSGPKVVGKRA